MTGPSATVTARGRGGSDEWWTPRHILEAVGPFDLDPASPGGSWMTAPRVFTEGDDGLSQRWQGFVWLNPPYSNPMPWMRRLAHHNNGIALLFARCETRCWFNWIWPYSSSMLFIKGRVTFVDGRTGKPSKVGHNSGGPSVLIGYGDEAHRRLSACNLPGAFLPGPFRVNT